MKFKVITAMYNVEDWIEGSLNIMKSQSYQNFDCLLIDDMSTDSTVEKTKKLLEMTLDFGW